MQMPLISQLSKNTQPMRILYRSKKFLRDITLVLGEAHRQKELLFPHSFMFHVRPQLLLILTVKI